MEKIVLVTGGSRGIGAATARLAARRGYVVALSYLSNERAANAVVADIERSGGQARAFQADTGSESDIERLFERVDRQLGTLAALVNNAGIVAPRARVDEMDGARLARIFAVNAIGTFLCCRQAIRRMSSRHGGAGGAIVNVSSAASRLGSANEFVDYAATKGAIDTMTFGLAQEVAAEGVRVNAVRVGLIDTEIHASAGDPGRVERLKRYMPMKRYGQPEEVAHAILWLLSEEASYASGAILDVTGGK